MDIRKWLAETENLALSEQPEAEHYLLRRHSDTVPEARRRRKRSSSDSSLLKAPSPQRRRKGISANQRDHYDASDAIDKSHSDASRSGSIESAASSLVSQRYARKPRRKTRADKYDIGSKRTKKRSEGQRPSRKSESRKSKRKSRRHKDNKTHNGIGNEFQASNVSKDRLTLKPSEKIGLFSKGRTSTLVKGRGLPDLVFSEMKFLRNNHGSNDHVTQTPDAKKKRKKDHVRTREEDISTFFTNVRPGLADTDVNIQTKSRRLTGSSAGAKAESPRRMRYPFQAPVTAVPAGESEGKASYLGFGGERQRSEDTSYFSWSEPIRGPTCTPERPRKTSTDNDKRIDAQSRETNEAAYGRGATGHHEVPSSIVRDRMTVASNRLQVSSVTPMPAGLSRSQNLPELSSSPRGPNLVDQAVNRHTNKSVASLSSIPPLLQGRSNAGHREAFKTGGSIETSYVDDHIELMQKQASRDDVKGAVAPDCPPQLPRLGEMMQHCNGTSEARPGQTPSGRGGGRHPKAQPLPRFRDSVRQGRHDLYHTRAQAPTVRFHALETQPSVLPNISGSSLYVQQEQRQRLPTRLGFEEHGGYHGPDGFGQPCMSTSGEMEHEDFGDFSDEQTSYGLMEDADDDVEGLDYVADGEEVARELQHTSAVIPGFWRPNRLY